MSLDSPQVAWVRIDTQTILTIHHNIITRNQRVSLSHHDREIWRLHLERVQESDRGWYMCQVNTDPMRSQRGFLEVVGKRRVIMEFHLKRTSEFDRYHTQFCSPTENSG